VCAQYVVAKMSLYAGKKFMKWNIRFTCAFHFFQNTPIWFLLLIIISLFPIFCWRSTAMSISHFLPLPLLYRLLIFSRSDTLTLVQWSRNVHMNNVCLHSLYFWFLRDEFSARLCITIKKCELDVFQIDERILAYEQYGHWCNPWFITRATRG